MNNTSWYHGNINKPKFKDVWQYYTFLFLCIVLLIIEIGIIL